MMENHLGTAGKPILNILEKNNFVNILVIVTRYFGGILLGTEIEFGYKINITTSYQEIEKIKYFCKINCIKILEEKFTENINLNIEITEEKLRLLKGLCIENLKSTKIDILSEIYIRK